MVHDVFELRRKSFEEDYFRKKDAELVSRLKSVFDRKLDRQSLIDTAGITNEVLLDRLVALSVSGEAMVAFKLYPLVEIAWAGGKLSERDGRVLLAAAEKQGVRPGSVAHEMLERRLREGPDPETGKVWLLYAEDLRKTLSKPELDQFRNDLLALAKAVAEASGGVLQMVTGSSSKKKKILHDIEAALTA